MFEQLQNKLINIFVENPLAQYGEFVCLILILLII